MQFEITKQSKKSRARIGVIKTLNGELETPAFFPVATQASIKTLTSEDIKEIGYAGVLANTYHLYLRPGEAIIQKMGGLHKFMNFKGVIATDSGGFQVFSLGKGKSHKTSKIPSATGKSRRSLTPSMSKELNSFDSPSFVKVKDEGVYFKSHLDGSGHFLSPEDSIKIQQALGGDIIFAFDEPSSPLDSKKETEVAMQRTHQWAQRCLVQKAKAATKQEKSQGLFGIIQGGKFKDLRIQSAKTIGAMDFAGFGIGGSFGSSYGDSKKNMLGVLETTIPLLPQEKPKHLLGIGQIDDFEKAITRGIDLFDCVYPTRMARHGIAFTSQGDLDMMKAKFLTDKAPIDKKCSCKVCGNYSRSYICHLMRSNEITGMRLLTFHNLWHYKQAIDKIKEKIKANKI